MNKRQTIAGRARLSDVAKVAGVSAATVSRVLSRPDLVADATRESVMQAVDATGYRMNHAARNLRKQRTGCVVALVPNLGNPFFAKILDGMGRELARCGYNLLVADTQEDAAPQLALHRFLDPSRADGIILLDGRASLGNMAGNPDLPPVITACEWIEGSHLPRVILDNGTGSRQAIEHLLALGHNHIGLICGPPENVLHKARLAGAQQAAHSARLTLFPGDFRLQAGQQAAQSWQMLSPDQRPTGILAFSDEMACAFMASLQRAGYSIPKDVSIIGFDDIELVSHLSPALTTVHQPKRELGRNAARVILNSIAGESVAQTTLLKPELMIRETTARL
ncbi:LacI family DNA-binding transcriptional regulator [Aureimonas fodinaquatilis]|uniref:LacI family DNA-binding transcriptional regulator n=1 Tax=Aureimonas fodinaquatilis TaxID=2565783 RepID=A0A5B0DYJ5_9HYPH|nr:LacI family DNA-binding transcriptional regulator [Aureimonas fodinaquatilis]KAA0970259.1 LacI family DNA-binding transcriptional regulator [Aureimonas fodinaquatilis]